MKRILIILTTIAIVSASAASFSSSSARADGGQVAAGILGGLAAGTILGAATAPRPYYYAPVYVEPAPVYVEPHVGRAGLGRLAPGLGPVTSAALRLKACVADASPQSRSANAAIRV